MVTITLIIIETLESKAAAIRAQVACYPVRRAARASPQCRVRVLARYSCCVRKLRILRPLVLSAEAQNTAAIVECMCRPLPSCCVAGIAMRFSNTAHTKNQNGTNVVTRTLHQSPSLLSSCFAYSTCSALCWLHCCVLRVLLHRFHRVLLQRF